jgi:hypothetical protein
MSVTYCYLCQQDPEARRRYGREALADGDSCPICNQPTCRYHLTFVRWRWRANGETDAALVCKDCKNSYAHRSWDAVNRDWIT